MSDKIYRPIVIVLLVLLVGVLALQTVQDLSRKARCNLALSTLDSIAENYQYDVYDNPAVDNINKQTFMAAEYQFTAQVAIAQLIAACVP